jgi:GWxTD domain-containing protein
VVFLAYLTLVGAACSFAADLRDSPPARNVERPRFSFDAGAVWVNDSAHVAVEISVPYRELMFRTNPQGYGAAFDIIVTLFQGRRQIKGDLWHETVNVPAYADTKAPSNVFETVLKLPATPGELRVEVVVSEPASGNEGRLAQDVEVSDPSREDLIVGKVWFGKCDSESTRTDLLPKQPFVSRRFGAATGSVCVWSRVYGRWTMGDGPVHVSWEILDGRDAAVANGSIDAVPAAAATGLPAGGIPVARDSLHAVAGVDEIPIFFALPFANLWLGEYTLRITAKTDHASAVRTIAFDMDETTVSLETNPVESIALVKYIAKAEEIKELENANPEDRTKVWEAFWARRPAGFKEEFFARVRYANEHFSNLGPGWKTDRGMIYITYGPPDQVESHPNNMEGRPYEIWTYDSSRRRFVFVDYDGFGRYELYTPGR